MEYELTLSSLCGGRLYDFHSHTHPIPYTHHNPPHSHICTHPPLQPHFTPPPPSQSTHSHTHIHTLTIPHNPPHTHMQAELGYTSLAHSSRVSPLFHSARVGAARVRVQVDQASHRMGFHTAVLPEWVSEQMGRCFCVSGSLICECRLFTATIVTSSLLCIPYETPT